MNITVNNLFVANDTNWTSADYVKLVTSITTILTDYFLITAYLGSNTVSITCTTLLLAYTY